MAKIVLFEHLTLDGVMQAPGSPDEDRRDGFAQGGWAAANMRPDQDPVLGKTIGESMAKAGSLLFGRRTYQQFYQVWPNRRDNPFTSVLNQAQKYVASRTLHEPLPWQNSTLLKGDLLKAVARLKREAAQDIVVLGSGELAQWLIRQTLVDRYFLLIHPLLLGSGRRLFPNDAPSTRLRLIEALTTAAGVVIAQYRPAEESAP